MGAMLLPRGLAQQPQEGVQIDWANPITRGLVFAYSFGNEAAGYSEDGRNRVPYTNSSSTTIGTRVAGPAGTGMQTAAGFGFAFGPVQKSVTSGAYSLFALASANTSSTQSPLDDDDGTTRRFQFRLNANRVEFIPFNSSSSVAVDVISPTPLSYAETLRGVAMGATASATGAAVYQNGVKTSAAATGIATPNSIIAIGGRKVNGTQGWWTGGISIAAMWNRTLSDAEMRSLAANPWQLFIGRPSLALATLAALMPAGTSAPAPSDMAINMGAQSLSIMGFAPTITQPIASAPNAGTLTVAGFAPSVSQPIGMVPGAGALSVTGFAPSVSQSIVTATVPDSGSISLTGFAPSVTQSSGVYAAPAAGALALTGYAPTVLRTANLDIPIPAAALAITGYAPSVTQAPIPADPRYARPLADITTGTWAPSSGTSLAAMLAEQLPDDSSYISTSSASACEIRLAPVVDPGTSSGQVVRYKIGSVSGNGCTVRLKQGASVIAEWTHASLPVAQTLFSQALTGPQCDSITDYSNLRFEFEAL